MLLGGFQKFSLIDYPGKVSAIVFTQGCNFRCRYCYNPELVDSRNTKHETRYNEEVILDFLRSRVGKLDAVVVTGGEPTIQTDLPEFIKKIKDLGFLVGLYTNGTNPQVLKKLFDERLIDYVSMDVKTRLSQSESGQPLAEITNNYQSVTGVKITDEDLSKIRESIALLKKSNIDYTIATTVVPGLVAIEDVEALASDIRGVKHFRLQPLVKTKEMLDNKYRAVEPYPIEELERLRHEIAHYFGRCEIRA
ncbi:anaerobic ribonucleoside-triphosphate reductase activating protein [Patescibacteria group bacterium]|nr:anaerobic ribonucleoside-triphosphate reductase activating protein [Patescibacteria group bacterium]MBU4512059.1 anaerobic ribonucleoside-triphosphate reductase activating protein [Patescibacteria group bacterium]MCG2692687.1 anaerobic ribonucleoside-triphosphate reductase activating protein [Candidatus Parcubacteria bacterium]